MIRKLSLRIICSLIFSAAICGCGRNPPIYREKRLMMGTYAEITASDKRALDLGFTELKRLEALLSKYDPESEIFKLNIQGKAKVSPDTRDILQKAVYFYRLTDGAFDITVAPLVELWGFKDGNYRLPEPQQIERALSLVGSDKINFVKDDFVVEFLVSGMQVDLGAIAKGYAVDCAAAKIRAAGITSGLINLGGHIYAIGRNGNQPWRVGVRKPDKKGIARAIKLTDSAVATSGDYEQFFVSGAKRYSHIIDPRTGYPAVTGINSVTVVAADCLTADALATGLFVLGQKKAQDLVRGLPGVQIWIIQNDVYRSQ